MLTADYYSETYDEKPAGKLIVDKTTIVACYTIPKYAKRTMLLTDGGLKFCVKGRAEDLMGSSLGSCDTDLLTEETST